MTLHELLNCESQLTTNRRNLVPKPLYVLNINILSDEERFPGEVDWWAIANIVKVLGYDSN